MYLVYGALCACLAVLLFCVTIIGARKPAHSWIFSDSIAANVWVPAIILLGIMGLAFVVQFFLTLAMSAAGIGHVAGAGAIVAATVGLVRSMGVRRRLAAFAAEAGPAVVLDLPSSRNEAASEGPSDMPTAPHGRRAA